MKTSDAGRQAIMHREGVRTIGYPDSRGIATNGVGHAATGGPPPVWIGQAWTMAEVDAVLAADLAKYEAAVAATIHRPMTQNQFDAFVSFAFNIGIGGFHGSHVAFLFNVGDIVGCANALLAWEHPPELKGRREGERAQFLRPDDPPPPPPDGACAMSIQDIQAALNAHGAKIDVDGDLGPQTLAAIQAFQIAHGLAADGVAGPLTQAALRAPPVAVVAAVALAS